jgi:hypothetical protein
MTEKVKGPASYFPSIERTYSRPIDKWKSLTGLVDKAPPNTPHANRLWQGWFVLNQGSVAPSFSLVDQDGNVVSTADYPDAWIVLWWFPRADTPG